MLVVRWWVGVSSGAGRSSFGQSADLGEVVGEDAVSAPGAGAGEPVEEGAIPAGPAFEVGDAAFAAGAPFDETAEGWPVFDGAAGLAVAAVGGHHPGWSAGAAGDAGDGRRELRRVGRVALLDGV